MTEEEIKEKIEEQEKKEKKKKLFRRIFTIIGIILLIIARFNLLIFENFTSVLMKDIVLFLCLLCSVLKLFWPHKNELENVPSYTF